MTLSFEDRAPVLIRAAMSDAVVVDEEHLPFEFCVVVLWNDIPFVRKSQHVNVNEDFSGKARLWKVFWQTVFLEYNFIHRVAHPSRAHVFFVWQFGMTSDVKCYN